MSADRKPRPLATAVMIAGCLGLGAVGVWQGLSGAADEEQPPVQAASPTPTVAPAQPGAGASSAPSPSPSKDEDTTPGDWDESDPFMPGSAPSYEPVGERKPTDEDADAARETLEAVVPAWATADLASDKSPGGWVDSFAGTSGSSPEFEEASRAGFATLYSGAIQGDLSTQDAKITSQKMLWNLGPESIWRVTVERKIVSNQGINALTTTEKSTWDFRLNQTVSPFEIVDYSPPQKSNESASTYVPERIR